jgi:hypothetical protein
MPACNAEKTSEQTLRELSDVVEIKFPVDDSSNDQTAALSRKLGGRPLFTTATMDMGATSRPYRESLSAGPINFGRSVNYGFAVLATTARTGCINGFGLKRVTYS